MTRESSNRPLRLFLSYAPADRGLKDDFEKHLRVLSHTGKIKTWSSDSVCPGDNWKSELDTALGSAEVALLLLSPEIWGSDFLFDTEIPALYERYEKSGMRLIPILLRSCYWEAHPWLRTLKPLPSDGIAIAAYDGDARDRVMVNVVQEIAKLANAPATTTRTHFVDTSRSPVASPVATKQPSQADIEAFFVRYGKQQYLASAKCSEAKNMLGALARNIIASIERENASGLGVRATFPPSAPRIPSEIPRATKFIPNENVWKSHPTWRSIYFTITSPMYFSYEIETSPDGRSAVVRALGDLDGDGKIIVFERNLTINSEEKAVVTPEIITRERKA